MIVYFLVRLWQFRLSDLYMYNLNISLMNRIVFIFSLMFMLLGTSFVQAENRIGGPDSLGTSYNFMLGVKELTLKGFSQKVMITILE